MDSITNLLRALAEAIRPYLGLDSIGAGDAGDIEGLTDVVEEAVSNYIANEDVMTSPTFDPDEYEWALWRVFVVTPPTGDWGFDTLRRPRSWTSEAVADGGCDIGRRSRGSVGGESRYSRPD